MTIASVNGDTFCCMMCRKITPIEYGVRRALNELIDVFHCVSCLQVSEKEVKSQVLNGLSIADNPALDKMIDDIAHNAISAYLAKKGQLN